jgi:anti-sigma B factor antagonist
MNRDIINIKAQEYGGIRVIHIKGELDSYTSERLRSVAKTWLKGASKVVVNLDALEYVDSAGLSTLVGMWVETQNAHVQMVISCNNPRIRSPECRVFINWTMATRCPWPTARMASPHAAVVFPFPSPV